MPKGTVRPADLIRLSILSGEWKPGERLQPAGLAKRYGTSSTVVREALTKLAGGDLVVARHNRGFFVRALNLRELQDITELRCVTEALAVELALKRGDVQWESELLTAHHQLARTPRRDPKSPLCISEEWQRAHALFHAKLLAACDCHPMTRLAANLAESTELYRRWAAPSAAAAGRDVEAEHRALLEAALERDVEQTSALLRAHYEATVRVVLESGLATDDISTSHLEPY